MYSYELMGHGLSVKFVCQNMGLVFLTQNSCNPLEFVFPSSLSILWFPNILLIQERKEKDGCVWL
jgi:hypothetical protein